MILIKEVLSPLWSSLLSIIIVIIIISNHGIVRGGGPILPTWDNFFFGANYECTLFRNGSPWHAGRISTQKHAYIRRRESPRGKDRRVRRLQRFRSTYTGRRTQPAGATSPATWWKWPSIAGTWALRRSFSSCASRHIYMYTVNVGFTSNSVYEIDSPIMVRPKKRKTERCSKVDLPLKWK